MEVAGRLEVSELKELRVGDKPRGPGLLCKARHRRPSALRPEARAAATRHPAPVTICMAHILRSLGDGRLFRPPHQYLRRTLAGRVRQGSNGDRGGVQCRRSDSGGVDRDRSRAGHVDRPDPPDPAIVARRGGPRRREARRPGPGREITVGVGPTGGARHPDVAGSERADQTPRSSERRACGDPPQCPCRGSRRPRAGRGLHPVVPLQRSPARPGDMPSLRSRPLLRLSRRDIIPDP